MGIGFWGHFPLVAFTPGGWVVKVTGLSLFGGKLPNLKTMEEKNQNRTEVAFGELTSGKNSWVLKPKNPVKVIL